MALGVQDLLRICERQGSETASKNLLLISMFIISTILLGGTQFKNCSLISFGARLLLSRRLHYLYPWGRLYCIYNIRTDSVRSYSLKGFEIDQSDIRGLRDDRYQPQSKSNS